MIKSLLWLVALQSLLFLYNASTPCELITHTSLTMGTLDVLDSQTCYLKVSTSIESPGSTLSSQFDATMSGINSYGNKMIKFLPANVGEKFLNLIIWDAGDCSIKAISRDNFQNLTKLRGLSLYKNEIEQISSDTLDDLIALEILWLDDNKITKLNGQVFVKLNRLKEVELSGNECISEGYFNTPSQLEEMPRIVSEKCGYVETSAETSATSTTPSNGCDSQISALKSNLAKANEKIEKLEENLKNDKAKLIAASADPIAKFVEDLKTANEEIFSVKAEVSAAKTESAAAKIELMATKAEVVALKLSKEEIKEVYKKLEVEMKETCAARLDSKLLEISYLNVEISKKPPMLTTKPINSNSVRRKMKFWVVKSLGRVGNTILLFRLLMHKL